MDEHNFRHQKILHGTAQAYFISNLENNYNLIKNKRVFE